MSAELQTVVVRDTGSELHIFETAHGVWREDTGRKHHSINIIYEDPDTGEVTKESIYGGVITYCAPTYEGENFPTVEELIEDTTVYDESYWGEP